MRTPSGRCQPHYCTIVYNSFPTDEDGGQYATPRINRGGIPCFVQPGEAKTIVETNEDGGTRRVTEIVTGKVYFVTDMRLGTHDLITWVDQSSVTHTFLVVGYHPPCGTEVHFVADVEERS